jgi:hypothetical protein
VRSGRLAKQQLSAVISIDSLGLKPGDIVHLRAVARDANDVSGPGIGVSETRSIRIARSDEYDSVAVDAAAPSARGQERHQPANADHAGRGAREASSNDSP